MSVAVSQTPRTASPDNSLADLLEDMLEARRAVEDIASDMHRQADLLMRSFRQLERSLKQLPIYQPPRGTEHAKSQ